MRVGEVTKWETHDKDCKKALRRQGKPEKTT